MSFLTLLFAAPLAAQEPEKPVVEVSQEALGEVEDAFQEHFFEALKQKAIENHDKAIDALVQALAVDPSKTVVYLELGKNFNALERYSEAAVHLEEGRKAAPKNEAILAELYNTYYLSKEFKKAVPVVKELSALDDSYSEDLVNLYILTEDYEMALALLDKLEQEKGYSTYRESLRRQVYARTGNTEAQVSNLQEKIAENPENETEYLNLIFVYSENGEVEKAFKTAQELLKKNPDSELVHLAMYKFYITRNNSKEAVNSMKILLGSDQIDEITKYQALNDFLLYVTENPALEEELVELVEIFSEEENNSKVYKQLGFFFTEKGDRELALQYYSKALESGIGDFGLYHDVLNLMLEAGAYSSAEELSAQALEIFPTQASLYLLRGKALLGLENYREAEKSLLNGLDFVIEDQALENEFHTALSEAYTGLGNPAKAKEFSNKIKPEK